MFTVFVILIKIQQIIQENRILKNSLVTSTPNSPAYIITRD